MGIIWKDQILDISDRGAIVNDHISKNRGDTSPNHNTLEDRGDQSLDHHNMGDKLLQQRWSSQLQQQRKKKNLRYVARVVL